VFPFSLRLFSFFFAPFFLFSFQYVDFSLVRNSGRPPQTLSFHAPSPPSLGGLPFELSFAVRSFSFPINRFSFLLEVPCDWPQHFHIPLFSFSQKRFPPHFFFVSLFFFPQAPPRVFRTPVRSFFFHSNRILLFLCFADPSSSAGTLFLSRAPRSGFFFRSPLLKSLLPSSLNLSSLFFCALGLECSALCFATALLVRETPLSPPASSPPWVRMVWAVSCGPRKG